jgi:hypothetical protein
MLATPYVAGALFEPGGARVAGPEFSGLSVAELDAGAVKFDPALS